MGIFQKIKDCLGLFLFVTKQFCLFRLKTQFSRKQAKNARFLLLNTSVLGLFSRKRGSINSGTGLQESLQIRADLLLSYTYLILKRQIIINFYRQLFYLSCFIYGRIWPALSYFMNLLSGCAIYF